MARILLVVPVFPQVSETFIVQKFLGLLDREWDVHIVCTRSTSQAWDHFPQLSNRMKLRHRVHTTWPARPYILAGLIFPLIFLRCLLIAPQATSRYFWRGWRRFGLDILRRFYLDAPLLSLRPAIIHFEFGALAVDRMYLKHLLGCRIIVSFRGYDLNFSRLEDPTFYHEVWEEADALHLLGEDLWKRAQRRGCPPDKPHTLIPPAIDTSFFTPVTQKAVEVVGSLSRPYRILSVGRLEWKKGYEYALQAVKELVDQGLICEYRIIGSGNYLEAISFACHDLGLENVVELLGSQSPSEVKVQLEWADVFLHASLSEGFCNVVLEAQAMGIPVVCTDAGGLPENVIDGKTGFVVPRRDCHMMAERLSILAANPQLRLCMGEAGKARITQSFETVSQLAKFDTFYQQNLYATS
jgi:colanic acid/amylovoran biosynthesis glycosyltransferase